MADDAVIAGETTAAGAPGGGDAWYSSIADDRIRDVAAGYDSAAAFRDALGPVTNEDWRADLPDELQPVAQRFASKADAVQAIADLRRRESTAIRIPGKDARPEEIAAYRKALGIPETPEGYLSAFPAPPGGRMTEEVKADRAFWAVTFHQAGVPAETVRALVSTFTQRMAAAQETVIEADARFASAQDHALRAEWQGDYDRNRAEAKRAIDTLAERAGIDAEALNRIEDKDGRFVFDDARVLRLFAALGREMADGTLGPAAPAEADRATMQSRLSELRARQAEAQNRGDGTEANRLYQEEQTLIARLQGARPVVGADGRAA